MDSDDDDDEGDDAGWVPSDASRAAAAKGRKGRRECHVPLVSTNRMVRVADGCRLVPCGEWLKAPQEVPVGRAGITRRVGRLQIALVNCAW